MTNNFITNTEKS